ncbi:aminotransferase [Bosea sp. (in: a-proteobacteria)]|jgi:4-aminobutyrate--pyruvate transaminase|uniref:aminotransferase n=1 Tax=Bosea sp. (in: a-proteobacteria) TaxID=1871050 RepID=UPI00086959CA|nr:aminotransferase [Bosea sp. (in: a-proteobacteria)]MBN9440207.1 aminotransferase class III-fold pyridoxal phosphate-dependent enzyme [Bosea sp. (in: a-proteobacteria)]MBN9447947.1 aminotransferase class III-fold pyridoxal phosphate-dependent enzyme [Bosea sp. (in: a-proteobacteria)]ODT51642.1 MAG: aminotransferase [Methylobacterium sp. SCN 67-24]
MLTNLAVRDIETLIHPYTNLATHREVGPLVLERGKGVFVYDTTGKDYIEGMAGLWCTSLGYSNDELAETAYEQLKKLPFTHIFSGRSHDPAIELAEKLKEIAPVPISKVFYGSAGSDANDTQVKLVWYMNNALGRPKKKKIISRLKGYHGVTVASASLTGLPANHTDFDLPLPGILHTSCPHHYRFAHPGESELDFSARLAAELDEMIQREGPDTVAAFIAEPVMGAGGAVTPPEGYFEAINAVLAKYDILFIADEVITGFGRTGEMFGTTTYKMNADTLSCAKALTSAYFPLSAVMVNEAVYEVLVDQSRKIGTFGHGNTYAGHPVGCAVAVKTLEIYQRDKIIERVRQVSPKFLARLGKLAEHPLVGEARGVGLIGGIELVKDKASKAQFEAKKAVAAKSVSFAQEEGVILRAMGGDRVAFCPPLVISEAEIDEMFDRYERALGKTLDWVKAEGLLAA